MNNLVPIVALLSTTIPAAVRGDEGSGAEIENNIRNNNDINENNNENNIFMANLKPCSLKCFNEGTCEFGQAEFGFAAAARDEEDPQALGTGKPHHEDDMYCKCPTGFTGLQCEVGFKMCNQGQTTCFNGAKCQPTQDDNGEIFYHCECDPAKTDFSSAYAGHFCQHAATVFCTAPNNNDTGRGSRRSFCTNGGRCKEIVENGEAHKGCECQDPWEGAHCQFLKREATTVALNDGSSSSLSEQFSPSDNGFMAIALFGSIAILLIASLVLYTTCKFKRELENEKKQQQRGEYSHDQTFSSTSSMDKIRPLGGRRSSSISEPNDIILVSLDQHSRQRRNDRQQQSRGSRDSDDEGDAPPLAPNLPPMGKNGSTRDIC